MLLADEPTGNLDHASAAEVLREIEALNAGGMTLLWSRTMPRWPRVRGGTCACATDGWCRIRRWRQRVIRALLRSRSHLLPVAVGAVMPTWSSSFWIAPSMPSFCTSLVMRKRYAFT